MDSKNPPLFSITSHPLPLYAASLVPSCSPLCPNSRFTAHQPSYPLNPILDRPPSLQIIRQDENDNEDSEEQSEEDLLGTNPEPDLDLNPNSDFESVLTSFHFLLLLLLLIILGISLISNLAVGSCLCP